jgi:hypothetical protein
MEYRLLDGYLLIVGLLDQPVIQKLWKIHSDLGIVFHEGNLRL